MSPLKFVHLNKGWNAEPNAPELSIRTVGTSVFVKFFLNPFAYDAVECETGTIEFLECSRWRLDSTNDEAWYSGKGRFAKAAPEWGEFFEIIGNDSSLDQHNWMTVCKATSSIRHFLFYFRDEAFECLAQDWKLTRELPKESPW